MKPDANAKARLRDLTRYAATKGRLTKTTAQQHAGYWDGCIQVFLFGDVPGLTPAGSVWLLESMQNLRRAAYKRGGI